MCASDQSNGAESTDILYKYRIALMNENFNRFWEKWETKQEKILIL